MQTIHSRDAAPDYSDAPNPELVQEAGGDAELLQLIGDRETAARMLVESSDTDVGSNEDLKQLLDRTRDGVAVRKAELGLDENGHKLGSEPKDSRPI